METNNGTHYALVVMQGILLVAVMAICEYFAYTGITMDNTWNTAGSLLLAVTAILVIFDPNQRKDYKVLHITLISIAFFSFGSQLASLLIELCIFVRISEIVSAPRRFATTKQMVVKDVLILVLIIIAYGIKLATDGAYELPGNILVGLCLSFLTIVTFVGDDQWNRYIQFVMVVITVLVMKVAGEWTYPVLYYWALYAATMVFYDLFKNAKFIDEAYHHLLAAN